ncbi:hypothetical protein KO516_14390 [Citreicella sp. C3M06]|uniref:hypothetical protein n=1 Tax=Citreicella sp. C3M06 TaxID=2841564 RepID=UPI001C0A245D|nr:hypothetical protein [Citreicella sp. C3M06]MBU2961976.1 hypothetical protein [Citreicella sp. C3M06]
MVEKISFETFTNSQHQRDHAALNELALKLNRASLLISLHGYESCCEELKTQHRVVGSHVLSAINSISSILSLTENISVQVRESVLLSRGVYETFLLGAFCSIDSGARANRAALHSIYKTVRSQTQHAALGDVQVNISKSQRIDRKHPKVIEAMNMFGGSKNVRPCFLETRAEMISAISAKDRTSGILFAGVEAMIYDIGSEIVHGSYYAWDAFNAPSEGQLERLQGHYQNAHYAVFLSTAAFCRSVRARMLPSDFFEDLERFAMDALKVHVRDALDTDGDELS